MVFEDGGFVAPRVRLLPDLAVGSRAFFSDEFTIDPAAESEILERRKGANLLAKLAVGAGGIDGVES